MLADAGKRQFDIIICWKLDRMFRSLRDLVNTLQTFSDLGIEFIALRDHIDLTTASGRLMTHMLGAFAEFERSLIRTRVVAGLEAARRNGQRLGRPKLRNDGQIAALRDQGLSQRAIAMKLRISKGSVQKALSALDPNPSENLSR